MPSDRFEVVDQKPLKSGRDVPIEEISERMRRAEGRLYAIQVALLDDHKDLKSAVEAGGIEVPGDPKARRRAALAAAYQRLISHKGTIGLMRPEAVEFCRQLMIDGEQKTTQIRGSISYDEVKTPVNPAEAVRKCADWYGYGTDEKGPYNCLRALERERAASGVHFPLPDRSQL